MNIEKNKKYLAIGPLPPPIGGDTVSFSRLISSDILKEKGVTLEVIDTSRKQKKNQELDRRIQLNDIRNGIMTFCLVIFKGINMQGVLIWSNSRFSYTIGLILVLFFKLINKKIFLKFFGTSFVEKYRKLPNWHQKLTTYIFKKVDYILPQTRDMCDFFVSDLKFETNQIIQFPNFLPFTPVVRDKVRFGKKLKCVYLGRIRKEKGIYDIIDAIKDSNQLECSFYGPIASNDEVKFNNEIQSAKNLYYNGSLQSNQIINTLNKFDILLLPTFYDGEGYPAVVLEAYFSGIPVVVTNWKSLSEIVEDDYNGKIVPIHSPNKLREILIQIYNDYDKYMELCKNANETALKYTEKQVVGEILFPLM